MIRRLVDDKGLDLSGLLRQHGVTKPEELLVRAASTMIDGLKMMPAADDGRL